MSGTSGTSLNILVCALGGEGGGVLSEWLYDTAVHSGHSAQSTSIPGVAQRTGATTYYVEIFSAPDSALGIRRPVFSLNPVPGAIDLLVSSELLETVRQIGLGMASAERTWVVSSSARALTVAEKMQMGDGRQDEAALLATVHASAHTCEVLDMAALARQSGTVISAVLFGTIAASGRLPFSRESFEATIRRSGKGVDASLRGFALAYEAVVARRAQQAQGQAWIAQAVTDLTPAVDARTAATQQALQALPAAVRQQFPAATHDLIALGHARLLDYQDAAYAALYVQRLAQVLEAELSIDPTGTHNWAATRETARWLALWMAFDDIVRVAGLKLSGARTARVRREVAARDDEVVRIYDHFKPGVPEFAALLPTPLAQRLSRWDAGRVQRGQAPWALPLKIGSHTVFGTLALRTLASLTGQRRRGSRYAVEQHLIEQWLAAVHTSTREHWALGHEVALCGRLIKGYGSTNERGKHSLLHIIEHLAPVRTDAPASHDPSWRTEAIQAARTAALADDAGRALDQSLAAHGAPPRPLREQPIRWHRRRPDTPVKGVAQQS